MTTVLVNDTGFVEDDWTHGFLDWDVSTQASYEQQPGYAIDVPNTATADQLVPFFKDAVILRIAFPSSHDGRGFSIARHLRLLGYKGRLRAYGQVLADQYAMARRCGFDEVEISATLAARQPEEQWLYRANWTDHWYQERLRLAT